MSEYSKIIMEHVESPSNVGRLKDADAEATTGAAGRPPFMTMSFRIRDNIIKAVRYRTFGCAPAIAAGSVLTEMIVDRSISECLNISEQQLSETLGNPPKDKNYVNLAISTMREALTRYKNEHTN